jgi:hypothetical protein
VSSARRSSARESGRPARATLSASVSTRSRRRCPGDPHAREGGPRTDRAQNRVQRRRERGTPDHARLPSHAGNYATARPGDYRPSPTRRELAPRSGWAQSPRSEDALERVPVAGCVIADGVVCMHAFYARAAWRCVAARDARARGRGGGRGYGSGLGRGDGRGHGGGLGRRGGRGHGGGRVRRPLFRVPQARP